MIGLDHVALEIPADGIQRAREFYGEVLRLEEVAKPPGMVERPGVWFHLGDNRQLHLQAEEEPVHLERGHAAFVTDDLMTLAMRLKDVGAPVNWDDRWAGVTRFFTHDPFGNRLEFLRRKSDA